MNVLDYILIAILIIFTIRGFARGLINEIFGIGSLIIPLFLSVLFFQKMGKIYASSMDPLVANILGFFTVFICSFGPFKNNTSVGKDNFFGPDFEQLGQNLGPAYGLCRGRRLGFFDFGRHGRNQRNH